jgi:hypothetical protein
MLASLKAQWIVVWRLAEETFSGMKLLELVVTFGSHDS